MLLNGRKLSALKNRIKGKGLLLLSMQFLGLLLVFFSNLIMTRLFGEGAYGIYSLFTSWAAFLAVFGLFGMDDAHLTRVPILRLKQESGKITAHLTWSLKVNGLTILATLIIFFGLVHVIKLPGLEAHAYYLKFGMVLIVLMVIVNNLFSFLRSLDKIIWGEITEKAGRPLLLMFFLVLLYCSRKTDLAAALLWAGILSLAGILILQVLIIKNLLDKARPRPGEKGRGKAKFPLRPNFHYVLLNILYMLAVRVDILALGVLSTPVQVGYYNIALKFSDMVSYPLTIANITLPVLFASHRHKNRDIETPELLYDISRPAFFQSLALSTVIGISGLAVLGWYGEGFRSAFPALCVLLISNLLSAFGASMDVFYILSRKEKKVIACRVVSLLFLLPAAYILIPRLGILGASLATLSGNFIYLVSLQYLFYKEYGMVVHPFRKKLITESDQ